jgi:DNA polymerase V
MYSHQTSPSVNQPAPVPVIEVDPAWARQTLATVQCGFPSPAEDLAMERVDLNKVLIKHPQATFLMRVRGDSMREAGIDDGDVVLVDRAIKAVHGHVVVAVVDGEFTVKRLWQRGRNVKLQPANPTYPDILPRDGQTLEVWGVVTNAIKAMRV